MPPVLETEERRLAHGRGGPPRDPYAGNWDHRWGDDGGQDSRGGRYVPGAGLLAMRFMLVSIAMLFVTLGFAYFERSRTAVNWRHIRVPPLLWLSSALILASGWVLEFARSALQSRQRRRYTSCLGIAIGIGLAFLASQILALRELADQGIYLRHNPHSSLFYVVTGAHGLHLLGGIAALCFLLVQASTHPDLLQVDFQRQRGRMAVSALYWHFLTVLWLGLFLFLLLWS
jgi:cytochrome c oxidase subunit III